MVLNNFRSFTIGIKKFLMSIVNFLNLSMNLMRICNFFLFVRIYILNNNICNRKLFAKLKHSMSCSIIKYFPICILSGIISAWLVTFYLPTESDISQGGALLYITPGLVIGGFLTAVYQQNKLVKLLWK